MSMRRADLNIMQKQLLVDDEQLRAAGERRVQHGRKVAEVKADIERQLNARSNTPEQDDVISEHLNDLRKQYRRVQQLERLRDTNIREYWECGGSDELARLTGAST